MSRRRPLPRDPNMVTLQYGVAIEPILFEIYMYRHNTNHSCVQISLSTQSNMFILNEWWIQIRSLCLLPLIRSLRRLIYLVLEKGTLCVCFFLNRFHIEQSFVWYIYKVIIYRPGCSSYICLFVLSHILFTYYTCVLWVFRVQLVVGFDLLLSVFHSWKDAHFSDSMPLTWQHIVTAYRDKQTMPTLYRGDHVLWQTNNAYVVSWWLRTVTNKQCLRCIVVTTYRDKQTMPTLYRNSIQFKNFI